MIAPANPLQRPLRLSPHRRHSLYRMEQAVLFRAVLDIRFQQQAVHLCAPREVFRSGAPGLSYSQASAHNWGLRQLHSTAGVAAWPVGSVARLDELMGEYPTTPVNVVSELKAQGSRAAPEWMFSIAIWKP